MNKKTKELLKSLKEQARFRLAPNKPESLRKGEFILHDDPKNAFPTGVSDELLQKSDDIYIISQLLGKHPTELKLWKDSAPQVSELKKAMDASSGAGAEWIPTQLSSDLIRMVELQLKVASIFRRINMPTPSYEIPAKRSRSIAKLNVGTLTGQEFTTAKITLTAVTLISYIPVTYELDEDSIIPMLSEIKSDIAEGFAVAEERAVIDGDTSGTHQDADVTDSNDAKKGWNGLRKVALSDAKVDFGGAVASKNLIRSIPLNMGVYGKDISNLVWVCSLDVWHQMKNTTEVTTLKDYGPKATILKGELGSWDGSPIIVSENVRTDLDSTGVNDASYVNNTKTILICVRKDGFLFGDRRKLMIETDKDIKNQLTDIVASSRKDFKARYDTTSQKIVGIGYNIKTGSLS